MIRILFLILLFANAIDASAQLRYDTLYTRPVGTGALHSHIVEHTQPWNIHVLEIDLRDEYTTIKSIKAGERLTGFETTIAMARRFDEEGHRVVGAVNADFFSTGPISMQIAQGEFVRRETSGRPGIGFSYANDVMVEVPVFTSRLLLADTTATVHGVNEARGTDQMILYNRFFGASTATNEFGTEIVVESLDGWRANDTLRVVVRQRNVDAGNTSITPGEAVLSGHGVSAAILNDRLAVDDTLKLVLGVVPGIDELVELVSGGPFLVRNGHEDVGPRGDGADRHPRTSIGINADTTKLYLITVDGRQVLSAGMDLHELADFMVDIGVHTGINLDGGGSTTMVVRGTIDNSVVGGGDGRAVTNALAVISSAPEGELDQVRLRHDTLKVFRGSSFRFPVDGVDEYYNRLPLDSSMIHFDVDPLLGTVSESGVFSSVVEPASGYLRMTYGSFDDSTYVTLKDVGALRISPRELVMDTTRTFAFSFRAFDTDGARQTIGADEVSWSVVDDEIGTITQDGLFQGRAAGRTGIVAHYGDSVTDTAYVDVQLGDGVVMLDPLDSLEGWTTRIENLDEEGSGVSIVEAEDGDPAMQFDYRFVQGSASFFRMVVEKEFELYGIPEAIHVDVQSDGLNHRVFFEVVDNEGTGVTLYVPKFVNETAFDSLWAPATWSTMVPPITLKSVGVQFGNTIVAGGLNEGALLLRNLRVSYPARSSVSIDDEALPEGFALHQNYPNPFNPSTTIQYELDRASEVTLSVYNVLGQRVAVLVNGLQQAGRHSVSWDASTRGLALSSGTYFYVLDDGVRRISRPMILLK